MCIGPMCHEGTKRIGEMCTSLFGGSLGHIDDNFFRSFVGVKFRDEYFSYFAFSKLALFFTFPKIRKKKLD